MNVGRGFLDGGAAAGLGRQQERDQLPVLDVPTFQDVGAAAFKGRFLYMHDGVCRVVGKQLIHLEP